MLFCPYCGSENLPQARFCQQCGRHIEHVLAEARRGDGKDTPKARPRLEAPASDNGDAGSNAPAALVESGRDEPAPLRAAAESRHAEYEDEAGHDEEEQAGDAHHGEDACAPDDEDGQRAAGDEEEGTRSRSVATADSDDDDPEDMFLRDLDASRRRRRALGGIALLAVASGALLLALWPRHRPPPEARAVAPAPPPAPAPRDFAIEAARVIADVAAPAADAAVLAPVVQTSVSATPPPADTPREDLPPGRPRGGVKPSPPADAPCSKATDEGDAPAAPAKFSGKGGANAAVRTVARQHEDDTYDCLVSASASAPPKSPARVTVRFKLGSDGHATDVFVTSNNSGSDELASCLVLRVGEWTFPASAAGDVSVTHTFVFKTR